MLIHVVDVAGNEGRDPKEDFDIINSELKNFNENLSKLPMIVAGNKCDLATDGQVAEFEAFVKEQGYEFFPIMAPINEGVDALLNKTAEMLSKLPPVMIYEAEPLPQIEVEDVKDRSVKITNCDGVYFVEGKWLLRVLQSVNFDDFESLNYFQNVLVSSGVIKALKDAGIDEGDTVSIYDVEFDFVE